MTTYQEMDLYQVASVINGATLDELICFIDSNGKEIPLLVKEVSKGRIFLKDYK